MRAKRHLLLKNEIGLSGSAGNSGIAVSGFELNALFALMLLGWVFVPVYIR